MKKQIRVSRTTSYYHDVFNNIVEITQQTGDSFSEVVNELCRDGIAARRAAQEAKKQ